MNWEEAAQCKLLVAALIVEYLKRKNPLCIPFDRSAFMAVAPNVAKEPELYAEGDAVHLNASHFQSEAWGTHGLIKVLQVSVFVRVRGAFVCVGACACMCACVCLLVCL